MRLSEHFREKEFRCKCCGRLPKEGIDPKLIAKLECLRAYFGGNPVIITSGYRCPKNNKRVGGATSSQHIKGKAADIKIKNIPALKVQKVADKLFYNGGMGTYKTHTHVDTRGHKARWNG